MHYILRYAHRAYKQVSLLFRLINKKILGSHDS